MDIKIIEKLTYDWKTITWQVIKLEELSPTTVRKLFSRTYNLLDKYSGESFIPKQICGVLLEMHEFSWWVLSLDETPIHYRYQDIVALVCELNKHFLTSDADIQKIESIIECF